MTLKISPSPTKSQKSKNDLKEIKDLPSCCDSVSMGTVSLGALVSILRWKKRMESATRVWLISCVVQGTPLLLTNGGKTTVYISSHLRLEWTLLMSKPSSLTLPEVGKRLFSEMVLKVHCKSVNLQFTKSYFCTYQTT